MTGGTLDGGSFRTFTPVLPLNGSSRTLNRETTMFVLETPFHKDGQ